MKNRGVIFDLDGTLWDSTEGVVKSWNEVNDMYPEIDYEMTTELMKSLMGKTIEEIAKLFFKNITGKKAMEIIKMCCLQEQKYLAKNGGTLYPCLSETLKRLSSEYDLFIVSNCQTGYIDAFFEFHRLKGLFTDYEIAGRTGKSKGENIKLIIERNHLEKAVYIGDTEGDFAAAKIAGIPFIHAKYGFGKIEEAVPYINSVSELPEKVNELLK